MLYLVKRLWGLVLNIKLILFFLLTLSLGFHVPSDAYAAVDTWTAEGKITPAEMIIAIEILINQYSE